MTRLSLCIFMLSAVVASPALADDSYASEQHARSPFHLDFEIDPLAYIFDGHSLHVGLGYRRLRLDVGAFGLDTPHFLESHDDFDTSSSGFGAKFLVFPFAEQRGVFIGADANLSHTWIRRRGTELAARQREVRDGSARRRAYPAARELLRHAVDRRELHVW